MTDRPVRTILRHALTAFGAVSLTVFAVVFGFAFARHRKNQQPEVAWLREGGRDA